MDTNFNRPIPKYILNRIKSFDRKYFSLSTTNRYYSYLTTYKNELTKVTVAVKNHKKGWFCKQVAVHGLNSDFCLVNNLEYNYYGMGFRVGWFNEGLSKYKKNYEFNSWATAKSQYYNPESINVNLSFIERYKEFKYCGYKYIGGKCILKHLHLYKEYPQTEYLLKLGFDYLHDSKTILKLIAKDKRFCKWLIFNKTEITLCRYYVSTIIKAYKTGKPLRQIQEFESEKKELIRASYYKMFKPLFKDNKGFERFFAYLKAQDISSYSYNDYLIACNYLKLDMTLNKNLFPHDFKRWHDIRIDEYHSQKAQEKEAERKAMQERFASVARKYLALEQCKNDEFKVLIAKSPDELVHEGEVLTHCVGKMGYDQRFVKESSLIFFIRPLDNLNTPYVTVEYSIEQRKVLQCYGKNSLNPNKQVTNFVNNVWLPYANRKIKKLINLKEDAA